ncbi:MAG: mandelate racemase/muconate lactonizing enzyme family protein [Oscillospiraceae bacterium]
MKITSIDVMKLTKTEATIKGAAWNPIVVKINTDEGIYGYGEAGLCYGNANDAAFGICKDFAKLIIGMDPMENEVIWNFLHRITFWGMGGGGVIFSGMSAIDIALWDIKGKALGVPVYKLLGGKVNKKIRAYASQLQFGWGRESYPCITPGDYARSCQQAIDDGFDAVKVDPIGYDLDGHWMNWNNYGIIDNKRMQLYYDRMAAIRETGGPDMDIILELHSLCDTTGAIQLCQALEKLKIFYCEEPTQPLNPDLYKAIAEKTSIPLATGERSYSRWGYRQFFEDRTLRIIQPDLHNTGGITEGKKICDMAHTYDVGVQLHVCGSPLATAATLHLEAAMPNFVIHEHNAVSILPSNVDLCIHDYQPVNGYYTVPELPGIGQELSDWAIKNAITETITAGNDPYSRF